MYEKHFGLKRNPFSLAADPEFLFLTPQHREALAGLTWAIVGRKGMTMLTGEPGTGKTTLLSRVLAHVPSSKLHAAVVINPILTPNDFLAYTLMNFGVTEPGTTKAQRLWNLQQFLRSVHSQNKVAAIVVDEAHKLSSSVLEELRLLGNFEADGHKLLQIVLAGQPELIPIVEQPDMSQLKQRIALRLTLRPFNSQELRQYIAHRWAKAGGSAPPFAAATYERIAASSKGIPRLVNAICDNALTLSIAEGATTVEVEHVNSACRDLYLEVAAAPPNGVAVAQPPKRHSESLAAPPAVTVMADKRALANSRVQTLFGGNGNSHQTDEATEANRPSRLWRWAGKLGWAERNG